MRGRQFPEVFSEENPEESGTIWIKMRDAATLLGRTERATRDWIKRYNIPQRGERPVLVSEAAIRRQLEALGQSPRNAPEEISNALGRATDPVDVPYYITDVANRTLVPLDQMLLPLQELSKLSERLESLTHRNEQLALEVGTLRERTVQQDGAISELISERNALETRVEELTTLSFGAQTKRSWWRFWER